MKCNETASSSLASTNTQHPIALLGRLRAWLSEPAEIELDDDLMMHPALKRMTARELADLPLPAIHCRH
jgi:hypothetical protein